MFTFMDVVQRGTAFAAERFDPEATGGASEDYSDVVGEYYSEELEVTYSLSQGEEGLMVRGPLGQGRLVFLGADDQIRAPFGTLILRRERGIVLCFTLDPSWAAGITFERVVAGRAPSPLRTPFVSGSVGQSETLSAAPHRSRHSRSRHA